VVASAWLLVLPLRPLRFKCCFLDFFLKKRKCDNFKLLFLLTEFNFWSIKIWIKLTSNRETAPLFLTYVKFISVFNYGFDLLMINQWEYVYELNCPIPNLNSTQTEFNSTSTATMITTTTSFTTRNQRPIYCIKDGPEILDDLKIRPVIYLIILTIHMICLWLLFLISPKKQKFLLYRSRVLSCQLN